MTQFAPIFSALRRHRLATALIAFEIALACAVLCNACFLIVGQLRALHIESGVAESSLAVINLGCDGCKGADLNARVTTALRAVPGVQSVAVVNAVPFSQPTGYAGISLDREHFIAVPHFYTGGPDAVETLGLQLQAGRAFRAEDFQTAELWLPQNNAVWITRAFAQRLWPGQDPLGKEFWANKYRFRVIGVMAHLTPPDPGGGHGDSAGEWSIFVPVIPGESLHGVYALRANPTDLSRVLREARAAAQKAVPEAVLDLQQSRTVPELRADFFRQTRVMVGTLAGVIVALLLVTALGIVGLASFWVQQRRKQIGIRRAIGATRGDILRYFLAENFLIVTVGIAIGTVMTFALNLMLMKFYEVPRLPLYYLPLGALVLWTLGQLAVLAPAKRAADVPPVVATRSV